MSGSAVRRTQQERVALSDDRMLKAAVELLVEAGVAGTTLTLVGARAGYSRGLPLYRFGSKGALLAYVHDAVAADWIRRVRGGVGSHIGVQALERVVDLLCDFLLAKPTELRAMYLLRFTSMDPGSAYHTNVAKLHGAQRRDAQRWIEAGQEAGQISRRVDAALAAELFCATADGLVYRWLVTPTLPLVQLHKLLQKVVVNSLRDAQPPRRRRTRKHP